jgi:F0F1-type ATP synthase delta subunit
VLQELGHTSDIDEVEDELFRLARAVDDNINLRRVLADTSLSLEGRSELLADLLAGAKPATLRLATYVLHRAARGAGARSRRHL